jgi:hypothetical protein
MANKKVSQAKQIQIINYIEQIINIAINKEMYTKLPYCGTKIIRLTTAPIKEIWLKLSTLTCGYGVIFNREMEGIINKNFGLIHDNIINKDEAIQNIKRWLEN